MTDFFIVDVDTHPIEVACDELRSLAELEPGAVHDFMEGIGGDPKRCVSFRPAILAGQRVVLAEPSLLLRNFLQQYRR